MNEIIVEVQINQRPNKTNTRMNFKKYFFINLN